MESEPWAVFFHDIVSNYGIGWAVTAVAAFLILSRLDLVKRIFVERHRIEADREERVSEETTKLLDFLRGEVAAQRQYRTEDAARYEAIIARLREDNSSLTQSIALSERGNSRLRHALRDSLAWAHALYVKCLSYGIEVGALPLDELMQADPDLGAHMQSVMREGREIVQRRIEGPDDTP